MHFFLQQIKYWVGASLKTKFLCMKNGSQCWCGDCFEFDRGELAASDSTCNIPCSGDSTSICGGSNALSIYSTGKIRVAKMNP